ncbi:hypothetical protein CAL14_08615 [Bordetella genomosp. 9]|uniref:hypothetical protein n=1 Tax=Bordetella genomosp. 9 TaxID=1416803 RepID=UPI000A293CD8|nr:hypothetical protein [Bordetella genomosp. 9]ARP90344.1 hypothetical protein CAL14_08615 [Bordetella genomosp. 9]
MAGARPELSTNDIISRLRALSAEPPGYFNRHSIRIGALDRDIRKVLAVEPADGWMLKAMLGAYLGDEEQVREAYDNFERLHGARTMVANFATAFAGVGLFSEAQRVFRPFIDAKNGELSQDAHIGVTVGLLTTVADQLEAAKAMGMPVLENNALLRSAPSAAKILRSVGISDEDIGLQFDAVGDVLRAHRRMPEQISVHPVDIDGVCTMVSIQFHLRHLSPNDAFQMNVELAEAVDRRNLPVHDSLLVMFAQNPLELHDSSSPEEIPVGSN